MPKNSCRNCYHYNRKTKFCACREIKDMIHHYNKCRDWQTPERK